MEQQDKDGIMRDVGDPIGIILEAIGRGEEAEKLTTALQDAWCRALTAAMGAAEASKTGTAARAVVTLKLTIDPNKNGTFLVTPEITAKVPKVPLVAGCLWQSGEGASVRPPKSEGPLFREVGSAKQTQINDGAKAPGKAV